MNQNVCTGIIQKTIWFRINVIINHLYFCNIHDVNEDDDINNENFEEDIVLNQ